MYIYGKNVCREKLNTSDNISRVYLSKNFNDMAIISDIKNKGIKINYVDKIVLDKKVDGLHQGIVMEVDDIKIYTLEEVLDNIRDKNNPLLVMLDHLEDPHNFGAIIRTCEALGVDGIIIPSDRSVKVNGTVIKTSVGSISYMKIIRVANLGVAIKKLKDNGFWIIGTDMEGEDYTKLAYDMPLCLIIGNEGKGISNVIRKNCDYMASIPMSGKINSLNASVSCGIILSRIVAARGNNGL
ncbi:MAG: 23S rRNA (guanosine(2251)-2'-O)-methyltransferase RlmB [Bacilli bacterium]|nr:23S rRNA (guanosine(2251)-2'-O)-methyltransferase RlmB [Bacilli bacterium]